MPKKIRELKQILRKSGFTEIAGKGSHTNWTHPNYVGKLTVSGQDAKAIALEEENELDEDEV
jgi:predicted RNA binding protein YcfA (HicA-like mRNA interferase family)